MRAVVAAAAACAVLAADDPTPALEDMPADAGGGGDEYVWENVHLGSLPAEDVAGRLPEVRYGAAAAPVPRGFVVSHGYRYNHHAGRAVWHEDTWRFDFKTLGWQALPHSRGTPTARYKHTLTSIGTAASGGRGDLYFVGGDDGGHMHSTSHVWGAFLGDVYRYGPDSNAWTNHTRVDGGSSAMTPRAGHSTVHYRQHLIVFGGDVVTREQDDGIGQLDDTGEVLVYSFETMQWTALEPTAARPWPTARRAHTAVVIGGGMLVFGGFTHGKTHAKNLDDLWLLDLDQVINAGRAVWKPLPAGPPARGGHVAVADELLGKMWVHGGAFCAPSCACKTDVWEWDAGQRGWVEVLVPRGMRPVGRHFHSAVLDPATHYLYIFGGESYAPYAYFNDVWRIRMLPGAAHERYVDAALIYDGLPGITTLMDPHVSRTVGELLALRPPVYREHDRLIKRADFAHARLLETNAGLVRNTLLPGAVVLALLWWCRQRFRARRRAKHH